MKHDHPQFKLRLPPALKAALEERAAANDRTLTAEIVDRLQASLPNTGSGSSYFRLAGIGFGSPVGADPESNPHVSAMTRAASQINELQGQRNTLAIVLNALGGDDQDDQVYRIRRELDDLDMEIANLVQTIQSLRSPQTQSSANPWEEAVAKTAAPKKAPAKTPRFHPE